MTRVLRVLRVLQALRVPPVLPVPPPLLEPLGPPVRPPAMAGPDRRRKRT